MLRVSPVQSPLLRALAGQTNSPPPIWLMRQAGLRDRDGPQHWHCREGALANFLDGKYDWLQDEMHAAGFDHLVAWRESDQGHIDVRDLISTLEALNIFDFPNDSGQHPVTAYEKWSVPAKKFAADFDRHRDSLGREPLNGDLPRRP
jgi:hypothetical protein